MKQEYLDLLKELISYRPISAEVEKVNRAEDRMAEFLKGKGLYCVTEIIDGRHVVYASTRPGKIQDVLFNAHMDVVPAAYEFQYTAEEKDGRLYGRGSDDCLGNAVTVAQFLVEAKDRYAVSAVFTADEEIGGFTTAGMVKLGYGAKKAALVVDGGGYGRITYSQKGIIIIKLKAKGRGGHASTPWQFDNPIDKLMDGYLKLRENWTNPTAENGWGNSMAPCVISGGQVHNQIPDEAEMVLNIRYIADEDCEKIKEKVKTLTGLEISYGEICPPVTADVNTPEIQKLAEAYRLADPEHEVRLSRMHGATDARHLKVLQIPVAVVGVQGDGAHSKEEWLDLAAPDVFIRSLWKYMELLESK